jgi:hypothetical protein
VSRVKSAFLNLLTVVVSIGVVLLAAEIVLRFLPIARAPPVEPPTTENPIQRYVAGRPFIWSFDWDMNHVVRGRSNAQGFVADYDYNAADKRPLVAVVGDSFIEALQVPFAQSLTGRLQVALGDRARAYAFAQSGSQLAQYVAYARHACAVYRPERMVVSVVGNDFDESVYVRRGRNGIYHLHPRPEGGFDHRLTPLPPAGVLERVMRRSALALYLIRNVGITNVLHRRGAGAVGQTDADASLARVEEGRRIIDWFLNELPQAACLPARDIVIAVDTPRPNVYDAQSLAAAQTSYFGLMRQRIISEARAKGFRVVDTEPHFVAAYAADPQRFEHPTDGHWNARGHEVVAAAVRAALAGWPPLAAVPAL